MQRVSSVVCFAVIYYLTFALNKYIFEEYEFSFGVNWIFIPSGVQLILVLIAMEEAAIGIALACWVIGFESYFLHSVLITLITGLIGGLSPLLARKVCLDYLHVDGYLRNLTLKSILLMSLIFAMLSAALHQLWFFYNGVSDKFGQSLLVMAIGNLLGTALVLSFISLATTGVKRWKKKAL